MSRILILLFLPLLTLCSKQSSVKAIELKDEASTKTNQTLCLNMIVKDEAPIIRRCLDSVKGIIDYWVIVDTGSSDKTKKIIKEHMKGIPGELHERPWKDWGKTRTEALELAKGKSDYVLFMDADDILEFEENFTLPALTQDLYHMRRGTKFFSYLKPQIIRNNLPWKWVGVTHEYLACDQCYTTALLEGVHYTSINDGATRSTGVEKYWKNIKLLEQGLKEEPDNSRYAFYLAESYRDAGEKGNALEWFQKRIQMGGWAEEVFWSKLQIAHLLRDMGIHPTIVIEAYKDAHEFRPHRFEPLYYLAEIYNQQRDYENAYNWASMRDQIVQPETKDILFNEDWIEEYGLAFQRSICSYYMGHYKETIELCDQLLKIENLPSTWRYLTEVNRLYPILKLPSEKGKL